MNKTRLNTLVAATGLISAISTTPVTADVDFYEWDGFFTMLTENGTALANGSIVGKEVNRFQTPISGTMAFDAATGAGSAALTSFEWLNGTLPWAEDGIKLQAIGDGAGGEGSLVLSNMLFNWDGNTGMPVSIVFDAAGFFTGSSNGDFNDGVLNQADVAGYGAVPASDGTYVGVGVPDTVIGPLGYEGYLALGPLPIATTEFDTTNINGCVGVPGGCTHNGSSGGLPLITDTAVNTAEYDAGDGIGIGGNPMQDGPFVGKNVNFNFTELRQTGTDVAVTIEQNCAFDTSSACEEIPAIPVPAAVWLFGSGLLGLIGVARRRKFT